MFKSKVAIMILIFLILQTSCSGTSGYHWIDFSLTKYSDERKIVSNRFTTEESGEMYAIAVGKEDINSDGKDDIIALVYSSYYSGYNTNSMLCAFVSKVNGFDYLPLGQYFTYSKELKNQKNIGIRKDPNSPWKQWTIEGNVFRWDGTRYNKQTD